MPSEGSNIPTAEEVERSKVFVNFINILFAVVLGQSFVLITLPNQQGGFKDVVTNLSANILPVLTLISAYTLVISSFVSYNVSTRTFPIRMPARFVIDIVLLFAYYAVFASITSFGMVLTLWLLIFILYLFWNLFRLYEYWGHPARKSLNERTVICGLFVVGFIGLWILYNMIGTTDLASAITIVALFAFVIYRSYKRPLSSLPAKPN